MECGQCKSGKEEGQAKEYPLANVKKWEETVVGSAVKERPSRAVEERRFSAALAASSEIGL
jgi:hypothetical protein